MKRAYKLQEFVAHASNVNCLKIGKKTSRVLVTGGEDAKVNMWAIGRPNPIMSLSGHSSAVESVTFDTAEALVAAGAASGTIKLWDLEEAKVVRTLTGHRSNCIAVDFHPFGEFFASGSLDTNLKIWDIRRKGCIHTYKGHTRGVNVLKFSPDGRWVVSGGEDNIVKLWDLTAGKLMHDFKCHEGQILCLDFHPHEFLLATGSADRTVKFWDLETFELIGSAGPELSGARSMIFNPDGQTLLTGLHENLKVFSWEPSKCHDVVDVGWSKLADLNVHEGKLLACSYNQSCVGIWVVDLARVGPYAPGSNNKVNGASAISPPSQQILDGSLKSSNITRNTLPHAVESSMKDMKHAPTLTSENTPNTPNRVNTMSSAKPSNMASSTASGPMPARRAAGKSQANSVVQPKIDPVPVLVPRSDHVPPRPVIDASSARPVIPSVTSQLNDLRVDNMKDSFSSPSVDVHVSVGGRNSVNRGKMDVNFSEVANESYSAITGADHGNAKVMETGKLKRVESFGDHTANDVPRVDNRFSTRDVPNMNVVEVGRVRNMASAFDKDLPVRANNISGHITKSTFLDGNAFNMKGSHHNIERPTDVNINDSDIIEQLLQPHHAFLSIMQSRVTKLQVIKRFWTKNDLKGAMEAISKMADQSVLVDVLTCMLDRSEAFTLEVCALLLPQLNDLLNSTLDRYISTTLATLSLLVKTFGQMIHTTRTASPSFGVDLHAEERIERCNACYVHLLAITESVKPLLRRNDDIGKSAQDLSIALQEV